MKVYQTKDIRNVALLGHESSGKTTLSESIVVTSGASPRMGNVEEGTTKSDFLPEEIARQISVSTSLLQVEWNNHKVNVLDTPGYSDFIGEVIIALRAADISAIVVDAITGLEVGTETAWELTEKFDKPKIFIVNRSGKEHSDARKVLDSIQTRFGIRALPVQIPANPGMGFNRIIDIISMKQSEYTVSGNGKGKVSDIPGDLSGEAEELHEKLIEAAAESDDTLMEKFFDSGLSPEEVAGGVKKAILTKTLYPIVFVDSLTNVGIDLLLNLLTETAPSPEDIPPLKGKKGDSLIDLNPSSEAPLSMLVFKTTVEQHLGEMSLFRVFSGAYKAGEELYNFTHSASERPTLIYDLIGKDRVEVPSVIAGDVGTFTKMKSIKTGDTLCSKQMQIELPRIEFPEPVMDVAVYPKTKGDEDKISQGLVRLHDEDHSFRVRTDPELKQIILEGMGGLHIDVIIERLKRKAGMEVDLKPPKIPYRETITGKSDERYRYKKQTGGRGQYGEVYFRMEPTPRGAGYEFADEIKGGVIPGRFIPAVEKGIAEAMENGPLTHSRVIDLRVALYYGSYHAVDSSELAFKMAAIMCFRDCFLKAKPILLEPIYDLDIKVPDVYTGDVMGDLSSRRGKIQGMEPSGIFQVVKAKVPLAELYMYSTHLRSLTQGRGTYARKFSHYEVVPPDIAQKVIEASKQEQEELD